MWELGVSIHFPLLLGQALSLNPELTLLLSLAKEPQDLLVSGSVLGLQICIADCRLLCGTWGSELRS